MDQKTFNEEILAEYIFHCLVMLGYAPTTDEIFDLVSIFFDFMIDYDVIEEYDGEE